MKRNTPIVVAVTLVVSLVLVTGLSAQMTKDPKTGLDRIDGTVVSIDKKESTFTVRLRGSAGITYKVVYNEQTAFTYQNAQSTIDELKDGRRVICLGKAEDPTKLAASRVDIRAK